MIYCVEDDSGILNMMLYTLNASGFEARGFAEAQSFFAAMQEQLPGLIMLDVMLPGMDGLEILRQLKQHSATSHIPVIMATAKGTEFDKVIGLDTGADDYLTKPFGMMEMVSRIKAVLRRTEPVHKTVLTVGVLSMDTARHSVTAEGSEVQLTNKEYALLQLFMENPDRVYTREQLLSLIWETDYVGESRTVDVHVGTLRTKLGSCGAYIRTVRGVGYRLSQE